MDFLFKLPILEMYNTTRATLNSRQLALQLAVMGKKNTST